MSHTIFSKNYCLSESICTATISSLKTVYVRKTNYIPTRCFTYSITSENLFSSRNTISCPKYSFSVKILSEKSMLCPKAISCLIAYFRKTVYRLKTYVSKLFNVRKLFHVHKHCITSYFKSEKQLYIP